ncbi:hypothetical protein B4064_3132 [Caldibacillus thermoamylovorans]|nr:hypothetical protein B4064_3132 [Caldibacillus thermoamylovorans]
MNWKVLHGLVNTAKIPNILPTQFHNELAAIKLIIGIIKSNLNRCWSKMDMKMNIYTG